MAQKHKSPFAKGLLCFNPRQRSVADFCAGALVYFCSGVDMREIELHLASGSDVSTACRKAGVSDATYYNWRKKFGAARSHARALSSPLIMGHFDVEIPERADAC